MVTAVTLGNFYTNSSGKTLLGGAGGSGLDTKTLVESLTAARRVSVTRIEDQIELNDKKSGALTQLQTLLSAFQRSADALRNPPGVNNAASDAFRLTTASVGNGGNAYVSVLSLPGAALQTYNVSDISSIATAATQSSGTFNLASADADATVGAVRFNPGTITFAGGASLTISNGDSLSEIVANFNALSSTTGISATIISVDSTNFRVSFSATKTGTDSNFNLTTAPTVTSGGAAFADIGLGLANSATNANFKINGVDISRQSNNISDVVSNVTFKILQETPDGVTNYPVTISPDNITIQNSIVNFVNAYNAIKTFEAQQEKLNADGTFSEDAILINDQTFNSVIADINRSVNSQVEGILGTNPSSLSEIGITFFKQPASSTAPEISNLMTIDDNALASALATNFDGVKGLFQFTLTSNNPNLAVFSHTLPVGVTDFTLNITPATDTFTATYVVNGQTVTTNLTATKFTDDNPGYSLNGAVGSPLEGVTFIYGSNSPATITARVTQGFADKVYTSSVTALKDNSGSLPVALKFLKDSDTKLTEDIKTLNDQINVYQDQLLQKFAALEKAIASANTLLQSLSANADARLASAG